MTIRNKLLTIAAATALTAATAVPAMALENEFHGMFLAQGIVSNLNTGTTGPVAVSQATLHPSKIFVDQRARLLYQAKASDDLKLVTHFELDARWGDNSYTVGRNTGGALGADEISLETKNVYLDFNVPGVPLNAKVGIQGWTDAYKGIFFGNDAAGVVLASKLGAGKLSLGGFRWDDARAAGQTVGKTTRDFWFLDGAFNVTKDVKVGASYYLYNDDFSVPTSTINIYAGGPTEAMIHMLGVNAAANVGPVSVDGFLLYQNGTFQNTAAVANRHQQAFAANVAAKAKVGPGAVKASFLYTSGEKSGVGRNSFITAQNDTSAAWMESGIFTDANTILLFRGNSYRTSGTDQSIIADAGNRGAGLIAAFVGFDGAIGKTFFNANAAMAAAAKKQTTGAFANKSQYEGTEINGELGYKVYDNLKASIQAAYCILGPKYKGTDAADPTGYANNPYLGRVVLSYVF